MDPDGKLSMTASQHSFAFPSTGMQNNPELEIYQSNSSLTTVVLPQKRSSKCFKVSRENVCVDETEPEGRSNLVDDHQSPTELEAHDRNKKSSTLESNTKSESSVTSKSKMGARKTFMVRDVQFSSFLFLNVRSIWALLFSMLLNYLHGTEISKLWKL